MVSEDGALAGRIQGRSTGEASQEEAELYRRLAPRARLYGLKHLRDRSAADDLAHEVMMHAIESLRSGKVREPDKIASFVLGSCRMRVRELRKVAARRERIMQRVALETASTRDPGDGAALDRRRLEDCIQHLTPRLRTLVALTFYAERSSEEIARELDTTAGNVRVMRHRALGQLHACIEGNEEDHA